MGANNATWERASTDASVQRLRELGWIENRTVTIEYRWAEGRDELFAEIAVEFVRLKVDVILTYATPSSIAAKRGLLEHKCSGVHETGSTSIGQEIEILQPRH
jgi:putative tryptophan/tyrosine transport system substrate-binding protein